MIPVSESVHVLEPAGILQYVVLLEIQMNRSTAVPPSFAEEDTLFTPIPIPYMDLTYDPDAGMSAVSNDAATATLLLPTQSNVDVATTWQTLATRRAGTRAGCSDLETNWESDSHTVTGAALPASDILELTPCIPNAFP
jgi:hypothetical protein